MSKNSVFSGLPVPRDTGPWGDAQQASRWTTMNKNTYVNKSVSDEAGVRQSPPHAESAIGVWDVVVSSKYKCEKCLNDAVSLVLWDGYIEYLEYPLLCRYCDGPREFASAVKTIAEKVKNQEDFYRLVEKLLSFARKDTQEEEVGEE